MKLTNKITGEIVNLDNLTDNELDGLLIDLNTTKKRATEALEGIKTYMIDKGRSDLGTFHISEYYRNNFTKKEREQMPEDVAKEYEDLKARIKEIESEHGVQLNVKTLRAKKI